MLHHLDKKGVMKLAELELELENFILQGFTVV